MQGGAPTAAIRVASVPCDHAYIRHLEQVEDGRSRRVRRLRDPDPTGGATSRQSSWWPPATLSERWVDLHQDEFDLMHIHFGFDAVSSGEVGAMVDALQRHGKPLVYTAHDLRNPRHLDPRAHQE